MRPSPSSRRSWRRLLNWRASDSCTCASPRATSSSTTWGVRGSSGLGALQRLPAGGAERVALLRSGHEALERLLDEVVSAVAPARALAEPVAFLRERLDTRPFVPCELDLERRLFAAADPEPVRGIEVRGRPVHLPARITAPLPHDAASGVPATAPERLHASGGPAASPRAGARIRRARRSRRGRGRRGSGRRRAPRLLAALRGRGRSLGVGALVGGAALVLMLTLVPPATADGVPGAPMPSEPVSAEASGAGEAAATHPAVPHRTPRAPPTQRRRTRIGAGSPSPRGARPTRMPHPRPGGSSTAARSASRPWTSAASTTSRNRGRRSSRPTGSPCPRPETARRRRSPGSIPRRSR